jgi:hypothetical protein
VPHPAFQQVVEQPFSTRDSAASFVRSSRADREELSGSAARVDQQRVDPQLRRKPGGREASPPVVGMPVTKY